MKTLVLISLVIIFTGCGKDNSMPADTQTSHYVTPTLEYVCGNPNLVLTYDGTTCKCSNPANAYSEPCFVSHPGN